MCIIPDFLRSSDWAEAFGIRELPDENIGVGGKTVKELKKELGRK